MQPLYTIEDALDWLQSQNGRLTMDTLGTVEVRIDGIAYERSQSRDTMIPGARVLVAVNSVRTQVLEAKHARTNAMKGTRRSKAVKHGR